LLLKKIQYNISCHTKRGEITKIGTSGFSFDDWVGTVYPEGTTKDKMFDRYIELGFNAVELNFTYYSMPYEKTMLSLVERSPEGFIFSVKLNKQFTHEFSDLDKEDFKILASNFKKGISPLQESGKLGAILAQFPYSFKYEEHSIDYIKKLNDLFDLKLVVEFRNKTWNGKNFDEIVRSGISIAGVDVPNLSGLYTNREAFGKISYFRFHGRNTNWFKVPMEERYDYLYSSQELLQLAELVKMAEAPIFVFFNNCHKGQAAQNALEFMRLF